jgi:hypothetical protein
MSLLPLLLPVAGDWAGNGPLEFPVRLDIVSSLSEPEMGYAWRDTTEFEAPPPGWKLEPTNKAGTVSVNEGLVGSLDFQAYGVWSFFDWSKQPKDEPVYSVGVAWFCIG